MTSPLLEVTSSVRDLARPDTPRPSAGAERTRDPGCPTLVPGSTVTSDGDQLLGRVDGDDVWMVQRGDRPRPNRASGQVDIRSGEAGSGAEQWQSGQLRRGVRQAVAEIEGSRRGSRRARNRTAGAATPRRGISARTADPEPAILIVDRRISPDTLRMLVAHWFQDMVKYVVDVERGRIAIGGELHADAEQVLIEAGSRQQDIWGANYYPGRGRDGCVELTSLINISPARGNRGMEVAEPALRARIQALTWSLIGEGEAL